MAHSWGFSSGYKRRLSLRFVEHRLIPARVRSEWSRLKKMDLASIWSPASQASSHVGSAGVGVVSLRGASLSLPTFATARFERFFDCGRAVRCLVPPWVWSVYASCCFIWFPRC